jgi:O-antigen ligase
MAFAALCLCVLSQGYSLPVLRIGPSWAAWPTPPILTAVALICVAALNWRPMWPSLTKAVRAFGLFFVLCLISFALCTVVSHRDLLPGIDLDLGFPLYQIWIMTLAVGSLWAASTIRFDERRIRILGYVTLSTLSWIAVSICLTYQNFVSPRVFAPQLPLTPGSGPFVSYLVNWEGVGLGTIGYNHAYAASLILILTALWIHLWPQSSRFLLGLVMSLGTVATFLTGSRAGLAGSVLFFAAMVLIKRSTRMVAAVLALVPLAVVVLAVTEVDIGEMVQRQAALLEAPSTESLSERDLIWRDRLEFLEHDKVRWLIGTGFGSATASGAFAHNMYLHVIIEMGIVGLLAFGWFFVFVLRHLRANVPQQPCYFVATLCLLFSSLTQETLYPVPALGFALPLYLMVLAIVIRAGQESASSSLAPAEPSSKGRRADRRSPRAKYAASPAAPTYLRS